MFYKKEKRERKQKACEFGLTFDKQVIEVK